MADKFILDDAGNPVACDDLRAWGEWMGTAARHVGDDTVDGVRVSTVFLGLDHSFNSREPLLFETRVFGGAHDGYQERYTTRDDALKGHQRALALVTGASNGIEAP